MVPVTEQRPRRKPSPPDIDIDLHERAAQIIAQRFALPLTVATVVVDLAGIGGVPR